MTTLIHLSIDESTFDFERYWRSELEVLQPMMERAGLRVLSWRDGERDSFGPLSRIARCETPSGDLLDLWYG